MICRGLTLGFALLSILVVLSPAHACQDLDDKADRYALGRYLMGSVHPELTSTQQVQTCIRNRTGCLYRDESGLSYDLVDLSPDISVATQMRNPMVLGIVADNGYHGPLIANIKIGDTVEVVRQKLKSLPAAFPDWIYEDDGAGPYLVTDCQIRSSNNETWYYVLSFGRVNVLETVTAQDHLPAEAQ
jgi:hypothetical protein